MALVAPTATVTPVDDTMIKVFMTVPSNADPVSRWQHAVSFDMSIDNNEVWGATNLNPVHFTQDYNLKSFSRGRTVYVRGRYINTAGATSPWSPLASVVVSTYPAPPAPPRVYNIAQRTFTVTSAPKAGEVIPVLEYWYILHQQEATGFVKMGDYKYTTPIKDFVGLTPATNYAMSVKLRNAAGWSEMSDYTYFTTTAGAEVFLSSRGWVKAVPYVRVAGVWKMAQPYARIGGVWKASLQ